MLFRVESFLNGKKIQIASPKEPFSKNQLFHLFPKAFKYQSAAAWLATWLDHFEIDVVWTVFKEFLKLHTHISVFWGFLINFRDFRVFIFGYRAQNGNSEIMENLYFLVYSTPVHVDLCFDHIFNCLSIKTGINRNGLNLIYSEGLNALKTQLAAAWLAMWLNHCNFDVIWAIFLGLLKLRTHISVFRGF